MDAIRHSKARWTPDSPLEGALAKFGGDVVQAVQALKEAKLDPTTALREGLTALLTSLEACQTYCDEADPALLYPFARAERQVRDVFGFLFGEEVVGPTATMKGSKNLEIDLSGRGRVEEVTLGPHSVPRLFNGFWQLSSPAWGSGTASNQTAALVSLVESGLVAADMADHYVCSRLTPFLFGVADWCADVITGRCGAHLW